MFKGGDDPIELSAESRLDPPQPTQGKSANMVEAVSVETASTHDPVEDLILQMMRFLGSQLTQNHRQN